MHILTHFTDAMMGETNLRADLLFQYCLTFLKFNIHGLTGNYFVFILRNLSYYSLIKKSPVYFIISSFYFRDQLYINSLENGL